jgi:acetyl esterase/lipase
MELDPDRAYANAAFIPGAEAMPAAWAAKAAAFRAGLGPRAEVGAAWAPGPGLDLFRPEGAARGLMVFVHGGYWRAFGRGDWSHLAAGALARGWAWAAVSYTLAPRGDLPGMRAEVAAAVAAAAARVGGPVVVTGHSAGGQLAARMACADGPGGVVRVVPISPLAELAPLARTAMNADLRLSEAVIAAESPARLRPRPGVGVHVWVGGAERPAFLWQARTLSEDWGCPWTVEPGRHHFDVIEGLEEASSPLMEACLGGL